MAGGRHLRRTARRGASLAEAVGDSLYLERLRVALTRAEEHAARIGTTWRSLRRRARLDAFLWEYIQTAFKLGAGRQEMLEATLACQSHFGARGRLPRAWEALQQWKLVEPSTPKIPIPEDLVQAFFAKAIALGALTQRAYDRLLWIATGICMLVTFYGLLRPGELLKLTVRCIDLGSRGHVAVLALAAPKNRRFMGHWQFTIIEDETAVRWLRWWVADLTEGCRIYPGSYQEFATRFRSLARSFGVDGLTLGSLRAGGATSAFLAHRNLGQLQYAGRWRSPQSLQHYLQEAMARRVLLRLRAESKMAVDTYVHAYAGLKLAPARTAVQVLPRIAQRRRLRYSG